MEYLLPQRGNVHVCLFSFIATISPCLLRLLFPKYGPKLSVLPACVNCCYCYFALIDSVEELFLPCNLRKSLILAENFAILRDFGLEIVEKGSFYGIFSLL